MHERRHLLRPRHQPFGRFLRRLGGADGGGTGIVGPLYTGALFAAFEVTALVAGWGALIAIGTVILIEHLTA